MQNYFVQKSNNATILYIIKDVFHEYYYDYIVFCGECTTNLTQVYINVLF